MFSFFVSGTWIYFPNYTVHLCASLSILNGDSFKGKKYPSVTAITYVESSQGFCRFPASPKNSSSFIEFQWFVTNFHPEDWGNDLTWRSICCFFSRWMGSNINLFWGSLCLGGIFLGMENLCFFGGEGFTERNWCPGSGAGQSGGWAIWWHAGLCGHCLRNQDHTALITQPKHSYVSTEDLGNFYDRVSKAFLAIGTGTNAFDNYTQAVEVLSRNWGVHSGHFLIPERRALRWWALFGDHPWS